MTIRETAVLMGEIKSFYPTFGKTAAADLVGYVKLWHECLKEMSFEEGHAALMAYVKRKNAIYPPVPGKLLQMSRILKGEEFENRNFLNYMNVPDKPKTEKKPEKPEKPEYDLVLADDGNSFIWEKVKK